MLSEDDSVDVYLPGSASEAWFEFNSSTIHSAPRNVTLRDVPLSHIPVYVKAGSIVPLAPLIQHTDQLPGGPLEVHVYAGTSGGSDATFTLVEDDGETNDYISGQQRQTSFNWEERLRRLSWDVTGNFADNNTFTHLRVTFFGDGSRLESGVQPIGTAGNVSWAELADAVTAEGGR